MADGNVSKVQACHWSVIGNRQMTEAGFEKLIHAWWLDVLNGTLSTASVFTGNVQNQNQSKPYVVVDIELRRLISTNSGRADQAEVVFEIYVEKLNWQQGRDIAVAIRQAAENTTTFTSGDVMMSSIEYEEDAYDQLEDGTWQFNQPFTATVQYSYS